MLRGILGSQPLSSYLLLSRISYSSTSIAQIHNTNITPPFLHNFITGVMHDCANIFECSPPSRPDLPVYFFSRFLFCKDYLAKVSVPLALNIYTAVHNPISLIGRINLCKGVMAAVDVRPLLKEIDCPMICVQSTQDTFARPLHTEPFVQNRGGEVRSVFKALREPSKTCIVWMKGGHEVFQECRKQSQLLIEQILTGFFETHDITFPTAPLVDKTAAEQGTLISNQTGERRAMGNTVEDKFIDSVLDTMGTAGSQTTPGGGGGSPTSKGGQSAFSVGGDTQSSQQHSGQGRGQGRSPSPNSKRDRAQSPAKMGVQFSASDPHAWEEFSQTMADQSGLGKMAAAKRKNMGLDEDSSLVMDPSVTAFERQDSIAYVNMLGICWGYVGDMYK